mgnify:CR=1 FL=1
MVNISMNRAVHLARRDAHYRCFILLLEQRFEQATLVKRRRRMEEILHHLSEASREATCALRGARGWRDERLFVKYLALAYDGVKAALVMLEHEALLREDKRFFKGKVRQRIGARLPKFLGERLCDFDVRRGRQYGHTMHPMIGQVVRAVDA